MAEKLKDKVCLITGSTGIAAASARQAAREGASVFITSRTDEHCRALAQEITQQGRICDYQAADLTRPQEAAGAVAACVARFGRIDALFNVAGISGRAYGDGPVHECTDEGWDITVATNLKSMFLMCRETIRHMLGRAAGTSGQRGVVLNMASVLAFAPEPGFFATHAYAASKGAVISLSKAMAAYYAPHKIRVNVIAPALVRTPMSQRAQQNPQVLEFMKTKQPLTEDLIEAAEIASAAIFLLSDDARAITGDVLTIDAGWSVSG
jgi:NAD(P)-dependent dehydrogenase (short-subunit alcohol dehydrogenase family)